MQTASTGTVRVRRRGAIVAGAVAVVVGVLLGWVLLASGLHVRRVSSGSMSPTYGVGSWVLTREHGMGAGDVQRGDVIVFRYPFGSDLRAIKRVAAVPGDRVELHPDEVVVDGRPIAVQPVNPSDAGSAAAGGQVQLVAPGTVFLLGDNSGASIDSRSFGPLPESELAGDVLVALPASPRVLLGAALGVIAVIALGVWFVRRRRDRRSPAEEPEGDHAEDRPAVADEPAAVERPVEAGER